MKKVKLHKVYELHNLHMAVTDIWLECRGTPQAW